MRTGHREARQRELDREARQRELDGEARQRELDREAGQHELGGEARQRKLDGEAGQHACAWQWVLVGAFVFLTDERLQVWFGDVRELAAFARDENRDCDGECEAASAGT